MSPITPVSLDFQQVQFIVQAMYRVSASDGCHDREVVMMHGFYESCRADAAGLADFHEIVARPFDAEAARASLTTPELREALFRSCFLLAWADGDLSPEEIVVIDELARAFEVDDAMLTAYRDRAKDALFGSVARVADAASVAKLRAGMA